VPAIERILTDVLINLDNPVYPTRRELLLRLYQHNQMFVNQLKLTDEGWLLRQFDFDPDGSTSIYPTPASAAGFAGPYLVHTRPEAYTDYRRREVPTLRKVDLNLIEAPSSVIDGVQSEPDEVLGVAFYGTEAGWRVEVAPFNARGSYVVWYEPGYVGEQSILNMPAMLEAFTPLLTISTALDGLPIATWSGLDQAGNDAKRGALAQRLTQLEARYDQVWRNYTASLNQPQLMHRRAFESAPGMANRTRGGRRFFR